MRDSGLDGLQLSACLACDEIAHDLWVEFVELIAEQDDEQDDPDERIMPYMYMLTIMSIADCGCTASAVEEEMYPDQDIRTVMNAPVMPLPTL